MKHLFSSYKSNTFASEFEMITKMLVFLDKLCYIAT